VNIQVYTFPSGASVPWHIQPNAYECDYKLHGAFALQTDGEGSCGSHSPRDAPRSARVKPKDEPLTKEVQP
jgi:hypothetical protein